MAVQNPTQKILYVSPPLDIQEQVELLIQKGLIIADITTAKHWLTHISYFRFKNYSYSFKDYINNNGNYLPGTSFENISELYYFDRKLKMILFEAIESIEVSLKTQLSNVMSKTYGAHWYTNSTHFFTDEEKRFIKRNARFESDIPKTFDHSKFMKDITVKLEHTEELFLKHYQKVYEPIHPPCWMLMEIVTFGTLSLMFENLKPCIEKNNIYENFNLTKKQFISWLHCFSFIRNKCAHHARIVYSKINFAPSMPNKKSRQFLKETDNLNHEKLYAVLCCIQYMLKNCNSGSSFKNNLIALIDEFPQINYEHLGFTPQWRKEELWM